MIDFESLSERRKPLAVVGLGYVGLPLAVAFSHQFDEVGLDISRSHKGSAGGQTPGGQNPLFHGSRGSQGLRRHYRRSSHAHRQPSFPGSDPCCGIQQHRGLQHVLGRRCLLRIHCLSRPDRGNLCAHHGEEQRPQIRTRLHRRLLSRAHQPRRQGAQARNHHQDRFRLRLTHR